MQIIALIKTVIRTDWKLAVLTTVSIGSLYFLSRKNRNYLATNQPPNLRLYSSLKTLQSIYVEAMRAITYENGVVDDYWLTFPLDRIKAIEVYLSSISDGDIVDSEIVHIRNNCEVFIHQIKLAHGLRWRVKRERQLRIDISNNLQNHFLSIKSYLSNMKVE